VKVKKIVILILIALLTILISCDSDTLMTSQDDNPIEELEPVLSAISITDSAVITLAPGATRQLDVIGLDQDENPMNADLHVNWSTEIPTRATIDSQGVVKAEGELGHTWVYARVNGFLDKVALWVQKPESEPSTFEITLFWGDSIPVWWQSEIEAAAEQWEQVIRDTLPAVDVANLNDYCQYTSSPPPELFQGIEKGVRIYVYISGHFPPGTYVEAVGGPCIQRSLPHPTTVLGVIVLNREKLDPPPSIHRRKYVAHHEMGHVLGLVGQVQGFQPAWLDAQKGLYRGHLALFGYYLENSKVAPELSYANGGHWPFTELMGYVASGLISYASIGALMDLGYPAAWYSRVDIGIF